MILSNHFLAKCDKVHSALKVDLLEPGTFVARGFADLGYEAFVAVNGDTLLSLFTGERSSISKDEYKNLFLIPSTELLVDLVQKSGFNIEKINYIEQREWQLQVASASKNFKCTGETIEEVLLEVMNLIASPD